MTPEAVVAAIAWTLTIIVALNYRRGMNPGLLVVAPLYAASVTVTIPELYVHLDSRLPGSNLLFLLTNIVSCVGVYVVGHFVRTVTRVGRGVAEKWHLVVLAAAVTGMVLTFTLAEPAVSQPQPLIPNGFDAAGMAYKFIQQGYIASVMGVAAVSCARALRLFHTSRYRIATWVIGLGCFLGFLATVPGALLPLLSGTGLEPLRAGTSPVLRAVVLVGIGVCICGLGTAPAAKAATAVLHARRLNRLMPELKEIWTKMSGRVDLRLGARAMEGADKEERAHRMLVEIHDRLLLDPGLEYRLSRRDAKVLHQAEQLLDLGPVHNDGR